MLNCERVECSFDGGPRMQATPNATRDIWNIPIPPTKNGYVTVGIWAIDYCGNQYYNTYWYWLDDGIIKSIQALRDGRFRLTAIDHPLLLSVRRDEFTLSVRGTDLVLKIVG